MVRKHKRNTMDPKRISEYNIFLSTLDKTAISYYRMFDEPLDKEEHKPDIKSIEDKKILIMKRRKIFLKII